MLASSTPVSFQNNSSNQWSNFPGINQVESICRGREFSSTIAFLCILSAPESCYWILDGKETFKGSMKVELSLKLAWRVAKVTLALTSSHTQKFLGSYQCFLYSCCCIRNNVVWKCSSFFQSSCLLYRLRNWESKIHIRQLLKWWVSS